MGAGPQPAQGKIKIRHTYKSHTHTCLCDCSTDPNQPRQYDLISPSAPTMFYLIQKQVGGAETLPASTGNTVTSGCVCSVCVVVLID